jgi:hypothetical protein
MKYCGEETRWANGDANEDLKCEGGWNGKIYMRPEGPRCDPHLFSLV